MWLSIPTVATCVNYIVSCLLYASYLQHPRYRKLERERSFVWRIETGERRLDVVEFFWVCKALDQDPVKVFQKLVTQFVESDIEPESIATAPSKAAEPGATYRTLDRKSNSGSR